MHTHRHHDGSKGDHKKAKHWAVAQFLEIPAPFPEIVGIILLLISLWNYPAHKNWSPHILGLLSSSKMAHTLSVECVSPMAALAFWDRLHSAYGKCLSLSKPAFSLLWLALEFFPAWSPGPSLGGPFQGLTWDTGHDHPLEPHFPTTVWIVLNLSSFMTENMIYLGKCYMCTWK